MIWFKPALDDDVCINGVCTKQKIEQIGESVDLHKLEFEKEQLRIQQELSRIKQEAFQRQYDIDASLRNDVADRPQEPPIRVLKGGSYYQVLMPNTKYKGASVLIQILPLFTSEELIDLVAAVKDDNDLIPMTKELVANKGQLIWKQKRDVLFEKAESKEEAIAMLTRAYPRLMKKKEKTILTYNEDQLVDPITR